MGKVRYKTMILTRKVSKLRLLENVMTVSRDDLP